MGNMRANQVGLAGEFRVMSELLLRGHNPAKSYLENGADLILENGLRIEVKSSHKRENNPKGYIFSFLGGHRKNIQKLDNIDFVICWCIDDDCFYIIPPKLIAAASITICDTQSDTQLKYTSCKNNWGILNEVIYG